MRHPLLTLLSFCAFLPVTLKAEVRLPAIFGDHMVLQQEAKLPVWGWAAPGEEVTVMVGSKSAHATTDAAGKWRVELAPLPAQAAPITLTVSAKSGTVTLSDVLVGEVWLCSGQSNMAYHLQSAHNAAKVLPQAADPQLRLFRLDPKPSLDPQEDVNGKWELCTPESAKAFSAVGYFFGHELRQNLGRPVGLIENAVGGTPAQAWISLDALKKEPALRHYVAAEEKTRADFAQASAEYPAKYAAYQAALNHWTQETGPSLQAANNAWTKAVQEAVKENRIPPPQPTPSQPKPLPPLTPEGGSQAPTTLFNGMIAPIIPFAIKGVIWYQGETNAWMGGAREYAVLFPAMIDDWRARWNQGNFPFLFVQLAGYNANKIQWGPFLREAQLKTLSLPVTGMATAVDVGVPNNIHPQNKVVVGQRLSLLARHLAYGENVVDAGPLYQGMKVEGNTVRLTFTHEGSGLTIGQAPWVPTGYKPLPTDRLIGFTIAGADKKWTPAEAKIEGETVIVSSPQVPAPVAVRYDWANAPEGNFYNKEGLPAPSFRTDDWSDPAEEGNSPAAKISK